MWSGFRLGVGSKNKVKNEITAPRILAYTSFGQGSKNGINSPSEAVEWIRKIKKRSRRS